MSKKLILLIGAPGSGKTTDAKLIAEKHSASISSYSTGELIEKEIANQSAIGNISKDFVNKGTLVPTAIVIDIIVDAIEHAPTDLVLLDGFPAKEKELAYFCDFIFNNDNIQLISVIEVKVSKDLAKERTLAAGISEELFEHKMSAYSVALDDIEAHYKDKQILKVIDGEKDLDTVVADIDAYLESIYTINHS